MPLPENNVPTIMAAFGATGDLMRVKVIPALFHLHTKGQLPTMFRVVGFSRRPWSDDEFRAHVKGVVDIHTKGLFDATKIDSFLDIFSFQRGDFDEKDSYEALKKTFDRLDTEWGVCANKLFYLAVAPEFYTTIATHVAQSKLSEPCAPGGGWTRIVVEKPFGEDTKSARKIDEHLATIFDEKQIYRIDHYLGKEMLRNILIFRFSNNLFEIPWGKELIEKINIRVAESIGVEKRGPFYDATGTLRDVGQNHLLQIIALLTMERPRTFTDTAIREERRKALEHIKKPTLQHIQRYSFRAQYEGFREIPGVAKASNTETYFKVRVDIDAPRWKGVPIYMEWGKRLGEAQKEIVITFKHPRPCLCPPGKHHKNEVIIRLEPKEEILIEFWSKKPGYTLETEARMFHFLFRERGSTAQYTEEYEKMLLDCIAGDQTLFISTEEIRAMWRYIDPIVAAWKKNATPLHFYKPDDKKIVEEARVIESGVQTSARGYTSASRKRTTTHD
ncbi:MAG: glucose-6-phosphate dehydrogenase [Candidatus Kaiserbacteria bacterium]|nr:glucose-6-phosphate dehydrogenase [Candidatus Kaiserbacteria bacterium]